MLALAGGRRTRSGLLQTNQHERPRQANVNAFYYLQVSELLLATSGGTVRKERNKRRDDGRAGLLGFSLLLRQETTGLLRRSKCETHLPPFPTKPYLRHLLADLPGYLSRGISRRRWMDGWMDGRMEGWTIPNSVSDFAMHYRLPRPRRPPPRHVLRQARGPEGRGSRSDLEERSKRSECSKNDWRSKGRRRRRSSVRSGKERSARRVWSLYYRAAAANRRARCTYTATHSKLSG
jgi:hypothetical protein